MISLSVADPGFPEGGTDLVGGDAHDKKIGGSFGINTDL